MVQKGKNVKKGDVFGKLTALDDDEIINGRRYVLCKCECGTIRHFRVDRLISGITSGCGCNKSPRIESLIGKKYGHLTILDLDKNKHKHKYLVCQCDCGNITIKHQSKVLNGVITTCGQCKYLPVYIGNRYGKWVVIGDSVKENGRRKWLCQCECENHTVRYIDEYSLKSGKSTCCGCEGHGFKPQEKHFYDENKRKLYHVWKTICRRCNESHNKDYKYYGARGIKICDEWKNNFEEFFTWALNNGYKQGLTIDRIDVNGNYEPSNCRWVDYYVQGNNRRNNLYIEHNGVTYTATEWGRILNISSSTMYRYYHKGFTIQEIIERKGVSEK